MHWIGHRSISFNPRSREGSDCLYFYCFVVKVGFQSTLPRRERHMFSFLVWDFERFNPRSREGSDEIPPPTRGNATLVSIHAPAKGATSGTVKIADAEQEFQSTLPRRERLEALEDLEILTVVSIHAPAKGATIYPEDMGAAAKEVSIHAPAKGATTSTPGIGYRYLTVSIHAPAKGATRHRT